MTVKLGKVLLRRYPKSAKEEVLPELGPKKPPNAGPERLQREVRVKKNAV